jgi:hypothetical protein
VSIKVPSGVPQPQGPGEDPLLHYTKVFVRFLQVVFATFEKGAYRWVDDEATSDIIITDQATIAREVVEKRPAIILTRGPASFGNISMNQFAGPGPLPRTRGADLKYPNLDPETGTKRYTDLVACTMTYNCLSKEGLEAQRIAWISMMATRRLKTSLMNAGIHRVGEEVQVGSESSPGSIVQPEADNEITMVSVAVPFYFQDFWSIGPKDKLLLKHIDLALTSSLNYPAPGAVTIREPGMNGKVLTYDKTLSLVQRVRAQVGTPKPRK